MLTSKINTLTFIKKIEGLGWRQVSGRDIQTFLEINEHGGVSKADLNEIVLGDRDATKSGFNRSLEKWLEQGFIDAEEIEKAVTQNGQGRVIYKMSKKGIKFLEGCK